MLQDLIYALRMLRRSPGFTAVTVVTLALGIGANSAIFSVVNAVLFQKLPLRESGRVMVVWVSDPAHGWSRVGPTGKDFLDWKEQNKSFEDLMLYEHGTGTVTGMGEPEQVAGLRVTTNFGDFLGVKPALGRTFRPDEAAGRHNIAILSYGYWQRRFGSDPLVVGKPMTLNAEQYTIIGVLPANVRELFPADVVVPADPEWLSRADSNLGVWGRLKPEVTPQAASSEMTAVAERIARTRLSRKGWGIVLVPLESVRVEYIRPALLVLLGAVGFVLLISCANVANLMLVRAVARQREVAVRLALGAGRLLLVRQFLVESTLLSLVGGTAGLFLALWGTGLLMQVLPQRIPVPNAADQVQLPAIHLDGRVILFTLAVSLLTGILFGLIPALQMSQCNVNESLKEGGRGYFAGPRGNRTRATLVVSEAALALVLVIGATLMIRSFWHLLQVDPGFRPDHLVTVQIKLPNDVKDSPYREPQLRAAAFQRFLGAVQRVPQVRSAGLTQIVPLSQDDMDMGFFAIQEAPASPAGERLASDYRVVSPSFFGTMGIPLLSGRTFTDNDDANHPRVVMIDQSLARRFFPNEDPVGKHLRIPDATRPPREIVGVVGGVRDLGLDQPARPTVYFPVLQTGEQTMSLVVRSDASPDAIVPLVKDAIWSVDRDQPIYNVKTMDGIISGLASAQRLAFVLLGVFAFLAVTLAAIGIYGVTSYAVGQRTQEIGIRMALGAQTRDVVAMLLWSGTRLAVAGITAGLAATLMMARLLDTLLYGVQPYDAVTLAAASLGLLAVTLLAVWVPARRAAKVDPMVALRYE